jgi:hypothetical protein
MSWVRSVAASALAGLDPLLRETKRDRVVSIHGLRNHSEDATTRLRQNVTAVMRA